MATAVARAKKTKAVVSPADLAREYVRLHEAGRVKHEKADAILKQLAALIGVGVEIPLTDKGKKAVLVDRFDGKDLVWQPCGARRYELKITNA